MSQLNPMESDIARLNVENATLREEVAQLVADKEFVWSLWKRLQVASPDLTQAIAEVVRREKEKAEIKDRKVLQILQVKDSRIEQLEKLVIERNAEIKTLIEGKVCLEERLTRLQIENQEFSDRLTFQEDQLRSKTNKERTVDELHKQLVDAFERDKADLHKQLSEQKAENNILRAGTTDLRAVKSVQDTKVQSLQQDLVELKGQYDKILIEFEGAKKQVYKHDVDVRQLDLQLEYKDTEMSNLKKELEDLWSTHQYCKQHAAEQASVINQLQNLQLDTQKMLQTQTDSHQVEFQSLNSMYQDVNVKLAEAKALEGEQTQEIEILKDALVKKEAKIQELSIGVRERTVKLQTQMAEMEDVGSQVTATILEKDYKVHSLETERDLLRDRLREKNKTLKNLQKENVVDLDLDLTPVKLCAPNRGGPVKDAHLQIKYETLEKRYRNTQQLLKLKSREVDEIRAAHAKRLERLKNVQSNYDIVKKQLEAMEEEVYGASTGSKTPKRCDAKALRLGDSDKVWNELTFYKQENKALMGERLQLQEELDLAKVQNTQDKAEIHEMRVVLEQLKEDRNIAIEERDRLLEPDENVNLQLQSTKYELYGKESALESVIRERNELTRKIEICENERRKMRYELTDATRELAEKRLEVCNVKSMLQKVQKSLRKLKRGKILKPRSVRWQSDDNTTTEDQDWEEITEFEVVRTDTETDDTTLTSLAEEMTVTSAPTARQIESIDAHIQRQKKAVNVVPLRKPQKVRSAASRVEIIHESVMTKDVATSPHKFNDRVRRTFSSSLKNQLKNTKNRLFNLQEQMKAARREKIFAEKVVEEQRSTIDNLQKDLLSANQRLKTMRANHQRVSIENETLLAEKAVLEKRAVNTALLLEENSAASSPRTDISDDRKLLESRLKISSTECSKQLLLIKNLRSEMEEKESKIIELTERVHRLERDTAQKRLLLEDTRLRLKLSQEQLQANAVVIQELNCQVQNATIANEKQKVAVESAKKRVGASIKEKKEYETLYQKTTQKLEDTKLELEKAATTLSQTKVKLASKDREMNEIEVAAHEQMKHTVRKSEAAIDLMQKKLQNYQKRMNTYKRFVDNLSHKILRSTENARSVVKGKMDQNRRETLSAESLKRASQVARDILNINQADLDDLLNSEKCDFDSETDAKDHEWSRNCQRLAEEKGDFSAALADLMMVKIEEQFRLLSGLAMGS